MSNQSKNGRSCWSGILIDIEKNSITHQNSSTIELHYAMRYRTSEREYFRWILFEIGFVKLLV
ncbi:hypothetical protein WK68_07565 [Burkholderia ubonensis]|nr:hypothetical protein WK68_07565 [Burkholderia ubonensis]